jgi:hypothetical protein
MKVVQSAFALMMCVGAAQGVVAQPERPREMAAPSVDDWWSELGLTAEDVGLAVRPWTTNPPRADLERFTGTLTAAPKGAVEHIEVVSGASTDDASQRAAVLPAEDLK